MHKQKDTELQCMYTRYKLYMTQDMKWAWQVKSWDEYLMQVMVHVNYSIKLSALASLIGLRSESASHTYWMGENNITTRQFHVARWSPWCSNHRIPRGGSSTHSPCYIPYIPYIIWWQQYSQGVKVQQYTLSTNVYFSHVQHVVDKQVSYVPS